MSNEVVVGMYGNPILVDKEIADLVVALNRAGLQTVSSCAGHDYSPNCGGTFTEAWLNFEMRRITRVEVNNGRLMISWLRPRDSERGVGVGIFDGKLEFVSNQEVRGEEGELNE